jgi:hypothetical protein
LLKTAKKASFVFPLQFVLPDSQDFPAMLPEGAIHNFVTSFIPGEFLFPECVIDCRLRRVLWTAVPETTIHENSEFEFGENKIRLAKDFLIPPPARDVVSPKEFNRRQLRCFVAAPTNTRHHFRTLCLGENVCHFSAVSESGRF